MATTRDDLPLVSIALPVYNEEKHIEKTLESLCNQDYANLEILIFDNASTDDTPSICNEISNNNSKIRYHRHNNNIGAFANFNHAFKASKGKYMMWAAGHDKWSANLVSKCVALLDSNPSAIIAFGTPVWIDEEGVPLNKFSGWYNTQGLNPVARFFMVFWGSMNPILGLIRRDRISSFDNYNYVGFDLVFLAERAMEGSFVHATDAKFYRRQNRPEEDHKKRMSRYKSNDVKLSATLLSGFFPLVRLPLELIKAVISARVSTFEKVFIIALLLPSLPIRYVLGKKDRHIKH